MFQDEDLEAEATSRGMSESLPLKTVGPYRVESRLGRGGMGEIYRGHDGRLDRPVALKCVRVVPDRDLRTRRERFRREARALARVRHPVVVEVYDWVEAEDVDWLVMELLEGQPLSQIMRQQALPLRRVLEIARDLASGLATVHALGIVHRDLKPDNVMLLPPEGRVKLLDFGLAKRVESKDGATLTETISEHGQILGTVRFMSPEQAAGYRLDHRSDLFSLGAMLYEMLSGVPPFQGETNVETMIQICTQREAALRNHVPELPLVIAELVRRMLEKEPERRVASAREVGESLGKILTGIEVGSSESELLEALPEENSGDVSSETREASPTEDVDWALSAPRKAVGRLESIPSSNPVREPPEEEQSSRWRLAAWLLVPLLFLGLVVLSWTGRSAPLDVVVLAPVVGAVDDSVSAALVAGAIRGALERRLTLLEGISLMPPPQDDGLGGSAAEIARSLAVDEVVSSSFDCAASLCQVKIHRISAQGKVLWSQTLPSRADDLLELHHDVDQAFRHGHTERRGLPGADDLEVKIEDYNEFLHLASEARNLAAVSSLEELDQRILKIQESSPKFMDAYLLEGTVAARQFLNTRDQAFRDRALEAFEKAHSLAPRHPFPLIALADFARQSGAIEEMASTIEVLRDLIGGHPRLLALEALMAEKEGQVELALEDMRTAERLQPSISMKRYLGMMEFRRGNHDRASKLFEEILVRKPDELDIKLNLANIELLTGSPSRAAELFLDLAGGSQDIGVLMNLGVSYMLLGRWSDAEQALERAVRLAPDLPGLLLNLADARFMLGDVESANKGYRSILRHFSDTGSTATWQDLTIKGQALAHLGEKSAAVAAAQDAQRLAGDNPQVAVEVATVYAIAGERTSAIVSAQRARAAGVDARWFTFPWFDELRTDSRFQALLNEN